MMGLRLMIICTMPFCLARNELDMGSLLGYLVWHVQDLILLCVAGRFSLVKHPKLMELCRERNIALEVCPISNEILVSRITVVL